MDSPCYKCLERYIGCHSLCSKYDEYHQYRIQKSREKRLRHIVTDVEINLMKNRRDP